MTRKATYFKASDSCWVEQRTNEQGMVANYDVPNSCRSTTSEIVAKIVTKYLHSINIEITKSRAIIVTFTE